MGHRTENVELTVCVLVENGQGQLLMEDRQDPEWGGLFFPGGHVEPGESLVEAAIRETREETGLLIRNPTLCGVKQFPIEGGRYLVFFFRTKSYSGELHASAEGPVFWVSEEDFPKYRLADNLKESLALMKDDHLSELYWAEEQWNLR